MSAVLQYNECIDNCNKAVERGQQLNSDVELKAKAWTRKGMAYLKLVKCSEDYDSAIEAFHTACKMHKNQDTSHKLESAIKAKKELEQKERLSANRERKLGMLVIFNS